MQNRWRRWWRRVVTNNHHPERVTVGNWLRRSVAGDGASSVIPFARLHPKRDSKKINKIREMDCHRSPVRRRRRGPCRADSIAVGGVSSHQRRAGTIQQKATGGLKGFTSFFLGSEKQFWRNCFPSGSKAA